MTSAPKSAMIVVDTGPAMKLAASITRIPSRRRAMVRAPPVGRSVTRRGDRMRPGKEYRDSLRGGRRDGILVRHRLPRPGGLCSDEIDDQQTGDHSVDE